MGVLSFSLGRLRRGASATAKACKQVTRDRGEACDAVRQYERPMSLAELIAASAFLDFGGVFEERWLSGRDREETGAGQK
jgi:hypothetical protein